MTIKIKSECQECGGQLNLPELSIEGEIFSCPDCGSEWQLSDDGLKKAEVVGEDWGE